MKPSRFLIPLLLIFTIPAIGILTQSHEINISICEITIEWLAVEGDLSFFESREGDSFRWWLFSIGAIEEEIGQFDEIRRKFPLPTVGPIFPRDPNFWGDEIWVAENNTPILLFKSRINQFVPLELSFATETTVFLDRLVSGSNRDDQIVHRSQHKIHELSINCNRNEEPFEHRFTLEGFGKQDYRVLITTKFIDL